MNEHHNRFEAMIADLALSSKAINDVHDVMSELSDLESVVDLSGDSKDTVLNLPYSGAKPFAGLLWK